jgi:hypothetical protein
MTTSTTSVLPLEPFGTSLMSLGADAVVLGVNAALKDDELLLPHPYPNAANAAIVTRMKLRLERVANRELTTRFLPMMRVNPTAE